MKIFEHAHINRFIYDFFNYIEFMLFSIKFEDLFNDLNF